MSDISETAGENTYNPKLISSFDEYEKIRKKMSYEAIQKSYAGDKPHSLAGYESRHTRLANAVAKSRIKKHR